MLSLSGDGSVVTVSSTMIFTFSLPGLTDNVLSASGGMLQQIVLINDGCVYILASLVLCPDRYRRE
jgi:hypothetical protein